MKYHRFWLASALLMAAPLCVAQQQLRNAELENMLIQDCGSCHGLTFKGGLGPALLPDTLHNKSRDFLIQTVLQGRSNTAMPGWKNLLSEQEAAWMIDELINGIDKK
jgi:cytochrome c55X